MEKQKIHHAGTQSELDEIVEQAAYDRGCALDGSLAYAENAEFLRDEAGKGGNGADKMVELADLLDIAESKWFTLDG